MQMKKKQKKPSPGKKPASDSASTAGLLDEGMEKILSQEGDSGRSKKKAKRKPGKTREEPQTNFDLKAPKSKPKITAQEPKTNFDLKSAAAKTRISAEFPTVNLNSAKTKTRISTEFPTVDLNLAETKTRISAEAPTLNLKSANMIPPQSVSQGTSGPTVINAARAWIKRLAAPLAGFISGLSSAPKMTTKGEVSDHPGLMKIRTGLVQLKEKLQDLPVWVLATVAGVVLLLLLVIFWPSAEAPIPGPDAEKPVVKQDQSELIKQQAITQQKLVALASILEAAANRVELLDQQMWELESEATPGQDQSVEQRGLLLQQQLIQATERLSTIEAHIITRVELYQIGSTISDFASAMDLEQLARAFSVLQAANDRFDAAATTYERLSRVDAARESHAELVTRWQSFGFQWPIDPAEIQSLAVVGTDESTDDWSRPDLIAGADPSQRVFDLIADGEYAAGIDAWTDGATTLAALIAAATLQQDATISQLGLLLEQAELALKKNQLTSPEDENAVAYYRAVLEQDPSNSAAKSGLEKVVRAYHKLSKAALVAGKEALALQHASKARGVLPGSATVATMQREIVSYGQSSRANQFGVLIKAGMEAEQAGDFERLAELLDEAKLIAREPSDFVDLQSAYLRLQTRPGRRFMDALAGTDESGPEMIVMPTGEFTMGNASKMLGAVRSERPTHNVLVNQSFAVGRTEITVAQFRAFVAAANYQTDAERGALVEVLIGPVPQWVKGRSWRNDYLGGEATDSDPVVHVSWRDARQYVAWLAESTNRNYRLLSESEFEYVLRAGSTGRYLWEGSTPPEKTFNLNGQLDEPPVAWGGRRAKGAVRRWGDSYFGPAPAVSFPANAFGVKHVLGNVSEWVEDCYIENFQGKGNTQLARQLDGCEQRTLRGASWGSDKATLRASWRGQAAADQGSNRVGFRVAVNLG